MVLSNLNQFTDYLAARESGNSYNPQPPNPIAFGKYQFTAGRLNTLRDSYGLPNWINGNYFTDHPDLQEKYYQKHIQDLLKYIESYGYDNKYSGQFRTAHNGHSGKINIYGMLAGAHLGGKGGLADYLVRGIDHNDGRTYISDYVIDFSNKIKDNLNFASLNSLFDGKYLLFAGIILAFITGIYIETNR